MSGPAWLVGNMDDGVLRIEATRTTAVDWAKHDACADLVRHRYHYGLHNYGYVLGNSTDPEGGDDYFIGRVDTADRQGYDPNQPPLYPIPDKPYTVVEPPVDITATVPDGDREDVNLAAWVTAATAAGLVVVEQHVFSVDEYTPTRVLVGGRWYKLECRQSLVGGALTVSANRWE